MVRIKLNGPQEGVNPKLVFALQEIRPALGGWSGAYGSPARTARQTPGWTAGPPGAPA